MPTSTSTVASPQRWQLEHEVARATAEVAEAVARATAALLDGDHELAGVVATRHQVIVLDCRMIEDAALTADVGTAVAATRVGADLAAASRLARDIAASATRIPASALPPRVRGLLGRIGDETRRLVLGTPACEPTTAVVEDLHHRLLAELFAGVVPLSTAVELTLVGRRYDRLAAHVVGVADDIRLLTRSGR